MDAKEWKRKFRFKIKI